MILLCTLVAARPTRTTSSPVANGSSVPAWPVRGPPSARLTAATASCEVIPAGLSIKSTPSRPAWEAGGLPSAAPALRSDDVGSGIAVGRPVQLRGDRAAQEARE